MWKHSPTLEFINGLSENTMVTHCGIEFTALGDDFLEARMPCDARTVQPMRILHGGANVVLAETLGSVASTLCISDLSKHAIVGVEINANHLKSVPEGAFVIGRVTPIRVGRTMHVWNIEIKNERGQLCCISRLTVAVIAR
jgi:1,4-dihydroxy-2-naphthoyl-CoA hydrolase